MKNINGLKWEGNSKNMYNAIMNSVPAFFRPMVQNNIFSWINRNNISIVTEDLVFKAVEEIAPADLAKNRIKPELEKLRS